MGEVTDLVGDLSRVEVAYRSIHPRLWRALLAYTGDRDVASDAESEAFAQVLRRGDAVIDIAAWVWRSAFVIAGGMMAARGPRRLAGDVGERSEIGASLAEFLGLLGQLSDQQRACIVLRYAAQLNTAGIAAALGTSEGTVRVQLHRAHTTLRRTLKEADHG
jgi:RNA polymerase sigma-70 factor (ECF subfamily)